MPEILETTNENFSNIFEKKNAYNNNKFIRVCYYPKIFNYKHENSKLLIYIVSIAKYKNYQIKFEKHIINNPSQILPFPIMPLYRKMPQLNLKLPSDFFYPFDCLSNNTIKKQTNFFFFNISLFIVILIFLI